MVNYQEVLQLLSDNLSTKFASTWSLDAEEGEIKFSHNDIQYEIYVDEAKLRLTISITFSFYETAIPYLAQSVPGEADTIIKRAQSDDSFATRFLFHVVNEVNNHFRVGWNPLIATYHDYFFTRYRIEPQDLASKGVSAVEAIINLGPELIDVFCDEMIIGLHSFYFEH